MRILTVILFVALGCSLVACKHKGSKRHQKLHTTNEKLTFPDIEYNDDVYENDDDEYDDTDLTNNTAGDTADALAEKTVHIANGVIDGAKTAAGYVIDGAENISNTTLEGTKNLFIDGVKFAAGDSFKGNVADGVVDIADGVANGTRTFVRGTLNIAHDIGDTISDTLDASKPALRGFFKVFNSTLESIRPYAEDVGGFIDAGAELVKDDVNNVIKVGWDKVRDVAEKVEIGTVIASDGLKDGGNIIRYGVANAAQGVENFVTILIRFTFLSKY